MNNKSRKFIQNFSYTLVSNFISILITSLIILIVPKLIGIKDYGYWQLYLFYSSYVGFLHFGWNDGIYLRYGGSKFEDLNKKVLSSQFFMLVIFQLAIALVVSIVLHGLNMESDKTFIIFMTLLCMVISNINYMLLYLLQATNRIKEYAQITIVDRVFYSSLLIILLLGGIRNYQIMIFADLVGKFISLLLSIYYCRSVILFEGIGFSFNFVEAYKNINVGIKLMLSNIASMLVIGVVRLGIERSWNVETFGKVSLTLSISNLMMTFINAVGLIMFPLLRRTDKEKLPYIYKTLREILMFCMFGIIILYYPLKSVMLGWLPEYADGLKYMALLFPISIFEGKTSLLVNTYLKTMREEKAMLKVNILTLGISIILTVFSTLILRNLDLTVLSIVLVLAFRSIIAESYVAKIISISVYKETLLEILMTTVFISTAWFTNLFSSFFIYLLAYIIYIYIRKKELLNSKVNLTSQFKS